LEESIMSSREFDTDKQGNPVLCRDCGTWIKMVSEDEGKSWKPRNRDGSTHACKSKPRATSLDQPTEVVPSTSADSLQHLPLEIIEPMDIDKLAIAFKRFEDFKNRLLTPEDSVKIGNKLFLKKSAWRKWALACSVSDEILSQERIPAQGKDETNNFSYRITVRAYHIPTGRSSTGVAIASFNEKKAWAHEEHDVFSLCHTRAKSRAISDLVGGGEVSAEEMENDEKG
jgi:transcription initiation factor TFIIIB Brf1 subunit/transcription initiation factor TFIIB